jgi:hypothetical protein
LLDVRLDSAANEALLLMPTRRSGALGFNPAGIRLLLKATDGMSLPGLIVVTLQNGFFCLIIVNGFIGRVEQNVEGLAGQNAQGQGWVQCPRTT